MLGGPVSTVVLGTAATVVKAALCHPVLQAWQGRLCMYFVELEEARAKHLMECIMKECEASEECAISDQQLDGEDKVIECSIGQCTLSITCLVGDSISRLRPVLESLKNQKSPVFAFVDPYGFNIPMDFMASLLELPVVDVFLNLMTSYLNRFRNSPKHLDTFQKLLYLTGEQQPEVLPFRSADFNELSSSERWKKCGTLYFERLKEVFPTLKHCMIGVRDGGNQPKYHLILVTHHTDGLKAATTPSTVSPTTAPGASASCFHESTSFAYKAHNSRLYSLHDLPSECRVPHRVKQDGVAIVTTCGSNPLRLTRDHLVFTLESGLVAAGQLKVGDVLFADFEEKEHCPIKRITSETDQLYFGLNCLKSVVLASNLKTSTFGSYHALPAAWMSWAGWALGIDRASQVGDWMASIASRIKLI